MIWGRKSSGEEAWGGTFSRRKKVSKLRLTKNFKKKARAGRGMTPESTKKNAQTKNISSTCARA